MPPDRPFRYRWLPKVKTHRAASTGTALWRLCFLSVFAWNFLLAACGYHVAGRGSRLPADLQTIAVPALENRTARYRIEQRLTEAVVHELLARTAYRVVANPAAADAVLRGEISSIESIPLAFDATATVDPVTGKPTTLSRATTMLITVRLKVRLEERANHRVLFQNDNYLFREQYEISTKVASFFDESDPALDRMARDFAAKLVAAVLENF